MENIIFEEKTCPNTAGLISVAQQKFFLKPESVEELADFLKLLNNSQKIICLGAGSNTLIRDGGFNGVVIKLSPKFSYIKSLKENILEVGAGT